VIAASAGEAATLIEADDEGGVEERVEGEVNDPLDVVAGDALGTDEFDDPSNVTISVTTATIPATTVQKATDRWPSIPRDGDPW
jgi:hypothetical protein